METLYVTSRTAWRRWLSKHHDHKKEIWLIYYKKHTKKRRIHYETAVEEAICYGWIDSTVRRIDDEKYAQKFTPRKKKSKWNQVNINRAKKMIRAKRMTRAGKQKFENRVEYDRVVDSLEIPVEVMKALKTDQAAWKNFNAFAPSCRRLYLHWVTSAKKEETRGRRIKTLVERAGKNQKPGMM